MYIHSLEKANILNHWIYKWNSLSFIRDLQQSKLENFEKKNKTHEFSDFFLFWLRFVGVFEALLFVLDSNKERERKSMKFGEQGDKGIWEVFGEGKEYELEWKIETL